MRDAVLACLVSLLVCVSASVHSESVNEVRVHTEFLWEPSAPDALARSWAQGLLMEEGSEHQICLKLTGHAEAGQSARIDIYDAEGERVGSDEYHHPGGPATRVRCRSAQTHHLDASPGTWTYRTTLDGVHESVSRIEVATDLENAAFYSQPTRPYIVGRTNFTEDIAEHYQGDVVFDMTINRAGEVVASQIVEPDTLPDVMAERIHAAAIRYRFPPDPERDSLTVRQSLTLGTSD